jgi:membrane protease YdiL (CAAX protease family)
MEFIINPFIVINFNKWIAAFITSGLKVFIWTVPCIYLISKYKDNMSVSLEEMFKNRVNWLRYTPIFLIFAVYVICGGFIEFGKIAINEDFSPVLLVSIIFVGITEEMVFRGWILNATLKIMSCKYAVLLNAFLFLVIHFPIWIHNGIFVNTILSGNFLSILLLSVVFSATFIKSKNLFVPIALHMFWDLIIIAIFASK